MITDSLLERMRKLPVVLDIQPVFLCTDYRWVEDRIGSQRAKGAYAWKTLKDAGLIQTGSSDCPVESFDPIAGIYASVARADMDGNPPGGYGPSEKLSVYEAIEIFTKNVHYATGQQDFIGTLEAEESELKDIKVAQTYIAGRRVY